MIRIHRRYINGAYHYTLQLRLMAYIIFVKCAAVRFETIGSSYCKIGEYIILCKTVEQLIDDSIIWFKVKHYMLPEIC